MHQTITFSLLLVVISFYNVVEACIDERLRPIFYSNNSVNAEPGNIIY